MGLGGRRVKGGRCEFYNVKVRLIVKIEEIMEQCFIFCCSKGAKEDNRTKNINNFLVVEFSVYRCNCT